MAPKSARAREKHVSHAEYSAPAKLHPDAEAMRQALSEVEQHAGWILRSHSELHNMFLGRGCGSIPPSVPRGFDYDDVPPDEVNHNTRMTILRERLAPVEHDPTLRRWCQTRDRLAWAIRDWRDAIHAVRQLLPTVAPLMDDPDVIPAKRWTARLRRLLGQMGGCISANAHWRNLPPIDDSDLAPKLKGCLESLWVFHDDLKAIAAPTESIGPNGDIRIDDAQAREDLARVAELAAAKAIAGVKKLPAPPKTRRGFQRLAQTSVGDQRILAAIREGKSYREIAKEQGVGKSTVGEIAKAYGLTGHAPETVRLERTLEDNLSIRGHSGKQGAK